MSRENFGGYLFNGIIGAVQAGDLILTIQLHLRHFHAALNATVSIARLFSRYVLFANCRVQVNCQAEQFAL